MEEYVKFIVNDTCENRIHWSDQLTLFLVLSGECLFECQGKCKKMHCGDLWAVNPFTLYQLEREADSDVLKILFSKETQEHRYIGEDEEIFCRSDLQEEHNKAAYAELRKLLAELFLICIGNKEKNNLLIQSYVYHLLYCLEQGFTVKVPEKESGTDPSFQRLRRILGRIHHDYAEAITLKQVAQEEYLSVNYLSRYFQQKTGIGFNQYLNQVRLKAAVQYLKNTNLSVTEIAQQCGFGDSTQFIKRFHGHYGMSPGKYRNLSYNLSDLDERPGMFQELLKYADLNYEQESGIKKRVREQMFCVDLKIKGRKLKHNWKKLVNIGFAKEGLSAVIQNQLKTIQKEIGFEYIHFHGLLDDDMLIYSENEEGTPVYNFKYLDMLFDFFLSIGLKPYVELSFMPAALAKKSKNLFAKNVHLSMPNDMKKWEGLVQRLAVHCIQRYGLAEVRQWRFIPWSGPVGFSEYGCYQIDEYLELYWRTWVVLKAVSLELSVGGPAMETYYVWNEKGYYDRFIEYTVEKSCCPDFIAIDCYPSKMNEREEGENIVLIEKAEALSRVTSSDEAYMEHVLEYLERYHKKISGQIPEIVFLEWNSTMWQRDFTNDTCFKAAYIAKNLLENYDRAAAFGYWEISDYIEEVVPEQEEFHGGFGLFTCQGIKKSGYYCLEFLTKLGDRLIGKGKNYFVTKKGNGQIQIILYNYVHFNKLYRYRHLNGVDRTNRNGAFLTGESIRFQIRLNGLAEWKAIKIREYDINEKGGSAYDLWKNTGAPKVLTSEEVLYYQNASLPLYHFCIQKDITNEQLDFRLEPNSVKLVLLDRVDSE